MTAPEIKKLRDELNFKYWGNECHVPTNQKQPMTKEDEITFKELDIREMMISNLAYNHDYFDMVEQPWYIRNTRKFDWEKLEELGIKDGMARVHELWNEMKSDFEKHATIRYNAYEDSEGCCYNSIDWAK